MIFAFLGSTLFYGLTLVRLDMALGLIKRLLSKEGLMVSVRLLNNNQLGFSQHLEILSSNYIIEIKKKLFPTLMKLKA